MATLLRGWTVGGVLTATSGTPFTAVVNGDPSGTGYTGNARAQATGLPVTAGSGFFNTAAFTIPATGTFGNAGRDTIPGIAEFLADRVVLPLVPDRRQAAHRVPDRQHEPDQSRQYYGDQHDRQFHSIRLADERRRHAVRDGYSEAEVLMKRLFFVPALFLLFANVGGAGAARSLRTPTW